VGAETQGAVIEFLKSLEASSLFESAAVPSSQAPTQTEPLFSQSRAGELMLQKL